MQHIIRIMLAGIFITTDMLSMDELKAYNSLELKQEYTEIKSSNKIEGVQERYWKSSVNWNSIYSYGALSLDMDIEAYKLNQTTDTMQKNVSLTIDQDKYITIRSALAGISHKEISVYAGVISFRGGKFSEIKTGDNRGNGIELLVDQVFTGAFISYKPNKEITMQIGHVAYNEGLNYRSLGAQNDGSNGEYMIIKYDKGEQYVEFNWFGVDGYMDQDTDHGYKFGHFNLYALGYIYDASLSTGWTYWLEGVYSEGEEDLDKIAEVNMGEYAPYAEQLGYKVGENQTHGTSYKTGVAYTTDVIDIDCKVGIEYMRTNRDNFTMNHGVIFSSDYSYWQNKMSKQYRIFTNMDISKHISINAAYSISRNAEVPAYFSPSASEPWEESNHQDFFYTKHERISAAISIKF